MGVGSSDLQQVIDVYDCIYKNKMRVLTDCVYCCSMRLALRTLKRHINRKNKPGTAVSAL